MDRCAHYTQEPFNHWLVQAIQNPDPQQVVDLGVGNGSLLSAAAQRWQHADLLGIDVCAATLTRLRAMLPAASIHRADLMKQRVSRVLHDWGGSADVVLCNPPFTRTPDPFAQSAELRRLLPDGLPAEYLSRAEVVFLLHTLHLLRPGGEMGLVLPACFASGARFRSFRNWFFSRCSVKRVVQLPAGAFTSADVHAFLWVAENTPPLEQALVELALAQQNRLVWVRKLSRTAAVERCDAGFHSQVTLPASVHTLASLGVRVSRGQPVHELRTTGEAFFHTTHFAQLAPRGQLVARPRSRSAGTAVANAGDFLMGRVGRHCHAQVAELLRGNIVHSDCVYRLVVPQQWQSAVRASLFSRDGLVWRAARLRGSGARILALADLMQHPVWIQGEGEGDDDGKPQLAQRTRRGCR